MIALYHSAGSWVSALCTAPIATPSRINFTVSGSSQVVTQLSMSATVLSCIPSDIPSQNWKCTRAPTHQWPCSIKVQCHHYVSQWVVICLYQEGLIEQVLLEMFHNCPFQHQNLKLGQVVILLMRGESSATIGNGVISSVGLFLGQLLPQVCPWMHPSLTKRVWCSQWRPVLGLSMHACFRALKAFKASSESATCSDFLLAPSPVKR